MPSPTPAAITTKSTPLPTPAAPLESYVRELEVRVHAGDRSLALRREELRDTRALLDDMDQTMRGWTRRIAAIRTVLDADL